MVDASAALRSQVFDVVGRVHSGEISQRLGVLDGSMSFENRKMPKLQKLAPTEPTRQTGVSILTKNPHERRVVIHLVAQCLEG